MKNDSTRWPVLGLLLLVLLATIVVCPFIGPHGSSIEIFDVFDKSLKYEENPAAVIFNHVRLPSALFGAVVGFGLALAGAVFQALLRNPLATPYTLGLSGGASLGALVALHFGTTLFGVALFAPFEDFVEEIGMAVLVPFGAFVGAFGVVAFIGLLAGKKGKGFSTTTLLLAGVTLNLFFGAFILLLQYLSDPYQTFRMIRWMMGGLDVTSIKIPICLAAPTLACGIVLFLQARKLDLMSFGEETALHLGVEVNKSRWITLIIAGLMTAMLVAYSGPIGFVGLIVPHAIRCLFGPGHRFLLPATGLFGASFLIWCDTIARVAIPDQRIPVGIVTAFLGGPFFLFILLRSVREEG